MPRHRLTVPTYGFHKPSGQAYTRIAGQFVYLGPHGSDASKEKYARLIRQTESTGPASAVAEARPADGPVTVAQVLAAFLVHAATAYAPEIDAKGRPGRSQAENYKHALKPVARLYASLPATEFGPKALIACRAEMVASGNLCLNVINQRTKRIVHVFKWATEAEMIPGGVSAALAAVAPLRKGTPGVRTTAKVPPAPQADIDAALPFMPRRVAAMVRIQLLTGMRSGNLCTLRTCDIDRTNPAVWVYRPEKHKTAGHGHDLEIHFGPRVQEILTPFLRLDPTAYLFNPAEGEAERRALMSAARKVPLTCGNTPGNPKGTKRTYAPRYCSRSYQQAIDRACKLAHPLPPELAQKTGENPQQWKKRLTPEQWAEKKRLEKRHHWHPHQLRHNRATEVRTAFGLDAAQAAIGWKTGNMAQHYAEITGEKARKVAAALG